MQKGSECKKPSSVFVCSKSSRDLDITDNYREAAIQDLMCSADVGDEFEGTQKQKIVLRDQHEFGIKTQSNCSFFNLLGDEDVTDGTGPSN